MTAVNLRDFYPFYTSDCYVDVPDAFAELLKQWKREDRTYERKVYRHKAHYSLDYGDDMEQIALTAVCSLEEYYEKQVTREALRNALNSLPAKQGKRINAHYLMGMSKADIARAEGAPSSTIRDSIMCALKNLKKHFKDADTPI